MTYVVTRKAAADRARLHIQASGDLTLCGRQPDRPARAKDYSRLPCSKCGDIWAKTNRKED